MKKNIASFAFLIVFLFIYFLIPLINKPIFAADNCSDTIVGPNPIFANTDEIQYMFVLDKNQGDPTGDYVIKADNGIDILGQKDYISDVLKPKDDAGRGKTISGSIVKYWGRQFDTNLKPHTLTLYRLSDQPVNPPLGPASKPSGDQLTVPYCAKKIQYVVLPIPTTTPAIFACTINRSSPTLNTQTPIVMNINLPKTPPSNTYVGSWFGGIILKDENNIEIVNKTAQVTLQSFSINLGTVKSPGTYSVSYDISESITCGTYDMNCIPYVRVGFCQSPLLKIGNPGENGSTITLTPTPIVTIVPTQAFGQPTYTPTPVLAIPTLGPLCDQIANKKGSDEEKKRHGDCMTCLQPADPKTPPGVWSAIGCLPTDYGKLISEYIFKTGIGIAGGISFLYFLYWAFLILTSAGNPEKV